jgi:hypothetical protein
MAEKILLVFYQEIKYKWGRDEYIKFCSQNERSRIVWMKAGVWKLRGGIEKGTKEWRMQFMKKSG